MSKKMIIRFNPKYSLRFDPSFFKLRPGWQAIFFDIADKLLQILIPLYILLIFSFDLLSGTQGIGSIISLYALIITALILQIVKRVLGKSEYLPQVSYDLILLFFTTLIAISLFYHTAIAKDQINLWGGYSLRTISAISIIAYWFFYYLILSNSRDKKSLGLLIKSFFWAPIVMGVITLISFREIPVATSTAISCFIPGLIILLLTQKKNLLVIFINLIFALTITFISNNAFAIFSILVTFILTFIIILVSKRNKLFNMIRSLDKITRSEIKKEPLALINKHSLLIFFFLSLIISLYSLFWLTRNLSQDFFNGIVLGLGSLKFAGITEFLIGNGMADSAGGKIWQLIYSYGLLPILTLCLFLFYFWRDQLKMIKSSLSLPILGLIFWAISTLFTLTILLLIQNSALEVVIIISIFLVSILIQLKLIYLDKKEYNYSRELNLLSNTKDSRNKFLLKLSQFVLASLLIIAAIYLLCSLNYINIFLTE